MQIKVWTWTKITNKCTANYYESFDHRLVENLNLNDWMVLENVLKQQNEQFKWT